MIKSIYFAGPDVFRPDLVAWRERVVALCDEYGITPLLPCDGTASDARTIRETNLGMLTSASAVIANLVPFRGVEVDTGTAFEVGFACALGKSVVGFVPDMETLEVRVARLFGPLVTANGFWPPLFGERDRDGFGIEAFGLPTNLMIAGGVPIVVGDERTALAHLLAEVRK